MANDRRFPLPLVGGCRCGAIRYRLESAPLFIFACHCTDCQQLSASAFSLGMAAPRDGYRLTQGDRALRRWTKTGTSGQESHQYSCSLCADWVHTRAESAPLIVIIRPSTLDERSWVKPIAQIFTRSALPWALLPVPLSFETEFEDPAPLAEAFARSGIGPGGAG